MTNKEAIKILRDTPIDIRSTREDDILTLYATAQNMAIEALSAEAVKINGDLISREDAVALVIKAIHGTENKEIQEYLFDGLRKQMWSLPSAESTGAMDEAIQEYIKDGYMQPIGEDLISRQDAIDALMNDSDWADAIPTIKSLPSAEPKTGKWMRLEREENVYDLHGVPTWGVNYMCDKCGFITTAIQDHFGQYKWCPSCGARMYKGGDEE